MPIALIFTSLFIHLSAQAEEKKCSFPPEMVEKLKGLWECQKSPDFNACFDFKHGHSHGDHHGDHPHRAEDTIMHAGEGVHMARVGWELAHAGAHAAKATAVAGAAAKGTMAARSAYIGTRLLTALPPSLQGAMITKMAGVVARGVAIGGAMLAPTAAVPIVIGTGATSLALWSAGEFMKVDCLNQERIKYVTVNRAAWGDHCGFLYDDTAKIDAFLSLPSNEQQELIEDKNNLQGQVTCRYYNTLYEILSYRPQVNNLQCRKNGFTLSATFADGTVLNQNVKLDSKSQISRIENTFDGAGKVYAKQFSRVTNFSDGQPQGFGKEGSITTDKPSTTMSAVWYKRYIPEAAYCCQETNDTKAQECRVGLLNRITQPGTGGKPARPVEATH